MQCIICQYLQINRETIGSFMSNLYKKVYFSEHDNSIGPRNIVTCVHTAIYMYIDFLTWYIDDLWFLLFAIIVDCIYGFTLSD